MKRHLRLLRQSSVLALLGALCLSGPVAAQEPGFAAGDTSPHWQRPVQAPAGAPNVLLIMLDDVGFSDTATFGGPAKTPVLDQLAREGLRYNRFHATALCSPSRAALLTGRNAHRVGQGTVGEAGYPGYDGVLRPTTATVAEVLRTNGYSTAAIGKWHNTPFREISPVGPFDRWPTNLGFEFYYGNMLGASSQFEPQLWRNTEAVQQSKSRAAGYHFTTDMVDESIRWLNTHASLAPEKPYFLYLAPEAAHMPHEVPAAWMDMYKGQFDQGWDRLREETFARGKTLGVIPKDARLTPRPAELPAWDSLSAPQQKALARQMEVYAAFISHTDQEVGRLLETVRAMPGGDNTLIIYIVGDNGAAGEMSVEQALQMAAVYPGGGTAFYTAGWAWAGSTPFQWSKGVASHLGSTRNPMVVAWPAQLKDQGGLRSQFTNITDVAATIYDVAGIQMPDVVDGAKQVPLDGVSFANSFEDAKAPSARKIQYFETWGSRAIYADGWIAASRHGVPWRMKSGDQTLDGQGAFAQDRWELYNLDRDFSQANDLAAKHPEKLEQLKALFDEEAHKNNVFPLISNNLYGTFAPTDSLRRETYVFRAGMPTFLALSGPDFGGKSFSIEADVTIPPAGAEGVIFSHGAALSIYLQNGVLSVRGAPMPGTRVLKSTAPLDPGPHRITVAFTVDEGAKAIPYLPTSGAATLQIDGRAVDTGKMAITYSAMGEVDIGRDTAGAASPDYTAPFPFTGTIGEVRMHVPTPPAGTAGGQKRVADKPD